MKKDEIALKYVKVELDHIMKVFEDNHADREALIKDIRQTLNLCSRSIISVHRGQIEQGIKQFQKAQKLLKEHKKKSTADQSTQISIVEQEITEAACILAIIQKKSIPTSKSLQVSKTTYVLGLLDAIGELKRLTLNMIRTKKYTEAIRIFDIAVELYDELAGFSVYSNSVKDIRKKVDVARIVIDGMSPTIVSIDTE